MNLEATETNDTVDFASDTMTSQVGDAGSGHIKRLFPLSFPADFSTHCCRHRKMKGLWLADPLSVLDLPF